MNMISYSDLESLIQHMPISGSNVLSLYLNTDLSLGINGNRAFEIVLKDLLRDLEQRLDKAQREEFAADAERVIRYVDNYREVQRGLIIFSDESEDFFQVLEFRVPVRNLVWWSEKPYLRPLIEIMEEHERYGLVLTDRKRSRLFTLYLGELEEHDEAFAEADVTHVKASGTDHLRSQMNIERKADEHALWHLKHVAELMSRLARLHEFDRLILSGTVEAMSELHGLLSKALRARVIRKIDLPVDAGITQVLEEMLKVEEEVEREREVRIVEDLITASSKHRQGVLGLEGTLEAVREQSIWQLISWEGFQAPGTECTNCGALSAAEGPTCDYCGKIVRNVKDIIGRAETRVIELHAKVECIRGAAAKRLQEVGSIGAFLRY